MEAFIAGALVGFFTIPALVLVGIFTGLITVSNTKVSK
jgi:hypothetical protein